MHFSVGIIAALVAAASATASPVDVAEKRDVGVIKFFSQRNFGGFEHSQQAQFGVCGKYCIRLPSISGVRSVPRPGTLTKDVVNLPNEISGDCASVKVPDDAEECTFYR